MIRTVFGRAISSGRSICCQNSNQFTYYNSSHQYLVKRSIGIEPLVSYPRLLFTARNHVKQNYGIFRQIVRKQCTTPPSGTNNSPAPPKMSIFAKFKAMYKDYWYVLLPVHVVTSVGWFGAFYKVSSSGVDLGYYLKKMGVNETLVTKVTESGMGHIAVAWALYKIATPIRYAVTLGGTTWSIKVLRNMGYIKPAKELMAKGRDKIQSLKDKKIPKN